MEHDFSKVFDTENPLWQEVLAIFNANEIFPKKKGGKDGRALHHKFPRCFSKLLGEEIDNDPENLISLSIRDHFMIHYYYYVLAKPVFKSPMALTFRLMVDDKARYIKDMSEDQAKSIATAYETAFLESVEYNSITSKGRPVSEEKRKKIAKTLTGRKRDPEIARKAVKTRNERTGGHWTEEQKARLSEVRRGRPHQLSEDGRRRIVESNKANKTGKKATPEQRAARSIRMKQMWAERKDEIVQKRNATIATLNKPRKPISEESRRKMSLAQIGKKRGPLSEEHKQKISEAHKRRQLAKQVANNIDITETVDENQIHSR